MARLRATSVGHGVLIDFQLEVTVLLSDLLYLRLNFLSKVLNSYKILLQWVLHQLCIHFLLPLLHSLQRNDCFH